MNRYNRRRRVEVLVRLISLFAFFAVAGVLHAQDSAGEATQAASTSQATPTPTPGIAQETQQASPTPTPAANQQPPRANLENTIAAGDSPDEPVRNLVHWNEYHGPYFTMRAGGGLLLETAAFAQDTASKEQFVLSPAYRLRDFRFLLSGKLFPQLERSITWCAGIMYDATQHAWFVRQTGVQIAVPKLWGYIFIGRTKEGFSLERVMHGYDGWWMERSTMSDATIPLLADGFKWLGYTPKHHFLWNLGYYNDLISQGQSFSSYSSQEVARLVWLPIVSEKQDTVFHLGVNLRYGIPADHQLQLKSRPEAFPAPFFIDTGKFPADSTHSQGYEIYYRKNSLLFGSEYWWMNINSPSTGNPTVSGGDILGTWVITGETRPYNTIGGLFKDISPRKDIFDGGKGAVEVGLRFSNTDLNSKGIQGGKFKRLTPVVNWYLSDNIRLEFNYGYGWLDRFDLKGATQFFQSRVQFQL
jgi:phosphate-selective porin OprO and OprP